MKKQTEFTLIRKGIKAVMAITLLASCNLVSSDDVKVALTEASPAEAAFASALELSLDDDFNLTLNYQDRASFEIAGAEIGDEVKLFSDSGCATEVSSLNIVDPDNSVITVDLAHKLTVDGTTTYYYTNDAAEAANDVACTSTAIAYNYESAPVVTAHTSFVGGDLDGGYNSNYIYRYKIVFDKAVSGLTTSNFGKTTSNHWSYECVHYNLTDMAITNPGGLNMEFEITFKTHGVYSGSPKNCTLELLNNTNIVDATTGFELDLVNSVTEASDSFSSIAWCDAADPMDIACLW